MKSQIQNKTKKNWWNRGITNTKIEGLMIRSCQGLRGVL